MGKVIASVAKVKDGEVKAIAITHLIPFSGHGFTLYEGERLEDIVASIKKNGVIIPIIVRTIADSDDFEIISGHNRVHASKLAGYEKVPAVIKVGLSDEDALLYSISAEILIQYSISSSADGWKALLFNIFTEKPCLENIPI